MLTKQNNMSAILGVHNRICVYPDFRLPIAADGAILATNIT